MMILAQYICIYVYGFKKNIRILHILKAPHSHTPHAYTEGRSRALLSCKTRAVFHFSHGGPAKHYELKLPYLAVPLWLSRSCDIYLPTYLKQIPRFYFRQCGHEFCLSDAFPPIIKIDALCSTNVYPAFLFFPFM